MATPSHVDGQMADGWMDGQIDGRMDGQINGQMDGQMDRKEAISAACPGSI